MAASLLSVLLALKEKAMKCKVISSDLIGFPPLQNPSLLCPRDKNKIIAKMKECWDKKEEEINLELKVVSYQS